MISTKRILVTGANGDIANAIGRVLVDAFPKATIFGADLGEQWPGKAVFSSMYKLPRADSPGYVDSLCELINKTRATCVIPSTEPELEKLISEWDAVKSLPLLMNHPDFVSIGLNKYKTNQWLASIGIDVPFTKFLPDISDDELPVFLKPNIGSGSRGLEKVTDSNQFKLAQQADIKQKLIAQELLEPHYGEFTCAIFKYNNHIRTLTMRRWLMGGLTSRMIVEEINEIESLLQTIAASLTGTSVINVQLRLTDKGPRVFEINPRLSSTLMMRHKIGFSDLVWWINSLSGVIPPEYEAPISTRVYRTYDELVVTAEDA